MYQERAKELAEAGDEEARLGALRKWIQAAEQSGDQAALAQAHMQMGLAYQHQVNPHVNMHRILQQLGNHPLRHQAGVPCPAMQ